MASDQKTDGGYRIPAKGFQINTITDDLIEKGIHMNGKTPTLPVNDKVIRDPP